MAASQVSRSSYPTCPDSSDHLQSRYPEVWSLPDVPETLVIIASGSPARRNPSESCVRTTNSLHERAAVGARRDTNAACRGLSGGVPIDALCRVEHSLREAFRCGKANSTIRTAVQRFVARSDAAGASPTSIWRVLRYIAEHEAEPYRLDHGSVVTGKQPCRRLIGAVLRYAACSPAIRVADTKCRADRSYRSVN